MGGQYIVPVFRHRFHVRVTGKRDRTDFDVVVADLQHPPEPVVMKVCWFSAAEGGEQRLYAQQDRAVQRM
jgi:hypothetical protein